MIGTVASVWRYPVSSLAGEELPAIAVRRGGIEGDRLYGVVDVETGDIARPTEAKWHAVPHIAARLAPGGELEIAVPGSRWYAAPGERADRVASEFLGFAVTIRPLNGEAGDDGLSPVAHARYVKAPVHLLTSASLARLKALHPDGQADARRFRPSLVVDMPEVEGHFPETEWIGKSLTIGGTQLRIVEPCRRCGFTILAQRGLDHDPNILRNLVRHNSHNIGVYCSVEKEGVVSPGDAMRFV